VVILPLQMHEKHVVEASEAIYTALLDRGVDVLLDDRDVRGGIKFKDADLLGTPVRITVGARSLKDGQVELKDRSVSESTFTPIQEAPKVIIDKVKELYDSIK